MNRPWDDLRDKIPNPPMYPGVFRCCPNNTGLRVEFVGTDCDVASLRIGKETAPMIGVGSDTARVLAGFFTELADQLEGK